MFVVYPLQDLLKLAGHQAARLETEEKDRDTDIRAVYDKLKTKGKERSGRIQRMLDHILPEDKQQWEARQPKGAVHASSNAPAAGLCPLWAGGRNPTHAQGPRAIANSKEVRRLEYAERAALIGRKRSVKGTGSGFFNPAQILALPMDTVLPVRSLTAPHVRPA
eukprot:519450-Prorocentrum_minimum.AAC.1